MCLVGACIPYSTTLVCGRILLSLWMVTDSEGYPILLRTYVSRRSAGKGRALLEKLGLSPEKIALCYSKYPQDEEEVVQEGLYAWKDDVSSEPTWKTLVDAMLYAGIGVQYVEELKEELYQCENGEWNTFG